jgi:hypothetical protein
MFAFNPGRILVWVILGGVLFAATQYIPLFFYSLEFNDFVKDEVKFAPARETTEPAHLKQHISEEAKNNRMIIEDPKRDIRVVRRRDFVRGARILTVDVSYIMPVDLFYFTHKVKLQVHAETAY